MSWFTPSPEDQRLIDLLRQTPSETLPPAVHERLRERWLIEFRQHSAGWTFIPEQRTDHWVLRPAYALAAVAAVLVLSLSAAAASASAVPGDLLYGLGKTIDVVRLALAPNANVRAQIATDIAVQRQQNVVELNRPSIKPEVRAQAQADANVSLNTALSAISNAQENNQSDTTSSSSGKSHRSAALQSVEQKLQRIEELRKKGGAGTSASILTRASAKIVGSQALVTITLSGHTSRFTVSSTNQADIIAAISQRTGVGSAEITAVLHIQAAKSKKSAHDSQGKDSSTDNNGSPSSNDKNKGSEIINALRF